MASKMSMIEKKLSIAYPVLCLLPTQLHQWRHSLKVLLSFALLFWFRLFKFLLMLIKYVSDRVSKIKIPTKFNAE